MPNSIVLFAFILSVAINSQINDKMVPRLSHQALNLDSTASMISAAQFSSLVQISNRVRHFYSATDKFAPNLTQCRAEVLYLNQIIGLTNIAIWKNTLNGSKATLVLKNLQEQISAITNKIQQLSKQQKIQQHKMQSLEIYQKIQQLQILYTKIKVYSNTISEIIVKIKENSLQAQKLRMNITILQEQISEKSVELLLTEKQIEKLEISLRLLYQKKDGIQSIIDEKTDILDNKYKSALNKIHKQNFMYQDDLQRLNIQRQQANKKSLQLEFLLPKLQAQEKQAKYLIDQIKDQMYHLSTQKVYKQQEYQSIEKPSQINKKIGNLHKILNIFNPLAYQVYFWCFSQPKFGKLTGQTHTIQGKYLSHYLKGIFTDRVTLPQTQLMNNYKFQLNDIFSEQWTRNFGYPFSPNQFLNKNSLQLKNDSTCSPQNPQKFQSNNGRIILPRSREIYIIDLSYNRIKLIIGACTRIQCTSSVPQENNTIYFQGKIQNGTINNEWVSWDVFSIVCYD